jgi:urease accessory protein
MSGCGSITVAASGGRSRVTRAFAASPLRLLTPKNHGPASWIFTSTFGGGLVGGDDICLEVELRECAKAYLSTQAATKVYRSDLGTSIGVHAVVARDATLLAVPDPVICFAGSSYRQDQRFDLDEAGSLVFVDWLSSGRHAAGERWQFRRYESRVVIRRGGRPIVQDALLLSPEHGGLAERMGRFESLIVAILIGPALAQAAADVLARVERQPLDRRAPLIVSASRVAGGCLLRIAGTSVEQTGSTLRELLGFVPSLLGDDPWARKW